MGRHHSEGKSVESIKVKDSQLDKTFYYELSGVSKLTTDQLYEAFAKTVTVHARTLKYMSAIWIELEKRGEDLSDLKTGLAQWMPLIASGKLIAEAVIKFAGKKMLLHRMSTMSIEDQQQLIDDDTVDFVEVIDDKKITKRLSLSYLSSADVLQVFDESTYKLRTAAEQIERIDRKQSRPAPIDKSITIKDGYLKCGRSFVRAGNKEQRLSVNDLIQVLSDYYAVNLVNIINQHEKQL